MDNIDSLLVDMIDLGLAESRVKIEATKVFTNEYGHEKRASYILNFQQFDKIVGKINHDEILKSLSDFEYSIDSVNIKGNASINDSFRYIFSSEDYQNNKSLENFIKQISLYYYSVNIVELSIDRILIYRYRNGSLWNGMEFITQFKKIPPHK